MLSAGKRKRVALTLNRRLLCYHLEKGSSGKQLMNEYHIGLSTFVRYQGTKQQAEGILPESKDT